MGHAQRGLRLRGSGHAHAARGREVGLASARTSSPADLPLDAAVVPGLLMLLGWDLLAQDPSRALAWRLLHDSSLLDLSRSLAGVWPRPASFPDRDPVALLLGAAATGLAIAYLAASVLGARPAVRGVLVGLAALALVVAPTAAFVSISAVTHRPFGQDGGVVQVPLALDKILAGQSPYGADYSDSILGKESRASSFWTAYGGNPILRHHAYLPGTHLLMLPFYLACRSLFGFFDTRFVTLLAYGLSVFLATRLVAGAPRRLSAAALVTLSPLAYWHQAFGANDVIFVALLLAAVVLAMRERAGLAGATLGLACATKQLAWPFAPFLLAYLSGARTIPELLSREALARVKRPALAAAGVFATVLAPVAALDPRAFYNDIVAYNVGLPGGDNYPLGGTPGFGFANFLIYFGRVSTLHDDFPFGIFYLLLVPLGLGLLQAQLRSGRAGTVLLTGSAALIASLYFSRVVHPNYVIGAALLLPIGAIASGAAADVALVPLALLWLATGVAERTPFRLVWEQAVAWGLPARASGVLGTLAPRAGPGLTDDPISLAVSATAAGLAAAYLAVAVLGGGRRLRTALVGLSAAAVVVAPTAFVVAVGQHSDLRRAQDAWALQAPADAGRLARGASPYTPPLMQLATGREAWTTSFRLEPPRLLVPDRPLFPPGAAVLGLLLRPFRVDDARPLALVALIVCLLLLGMAVPSGHRPTALALAAVLPPVVLGTAFGSGDALILAAVTGAFLAARRGHDLALGVCLGLVAAFSFVPVAGALFLSLIPLAQAHRNWRRIRTGFALAFAVLALPVAFLDLPAFAAAAARTGGVGPGLGLVNLYIYRGLQGSTLVHALFTVWPAIGLAAVVLLALLALRGRGDPLAIGGLCLLVILWLAPEARSEALATPLLLVGLAAMQASDRTD